MCESGMVNGRLDEDEPGPTSGAQFARLPAWTVTRLRGHWITAERERNQRIRTWANANGYEVSDRGRLSSEVISAYEQAQVAAEEPAPRKGAPRWKQITGERSPLPSRRWRETPLDEPVDLARLGRLVHRPRRVTPRDDVQHMPGVLDAVADCRGTARDQQNQPAPEEEVHRAEEQSGEGQHRDCGSDERGPTVIDVHSGRTDTIPGGLHGFGFEELPGPVLTISREALGTDLVFAFGIELSIQDAGDQQRQMSADLVPPLCREITERGDRGERPVTDVGPDKVDEAPDNAMGSGPLVFR